MSMRYPGGLIATTPVNQQYPSGVWTGAQTTPYQANNVWGNDSSFKNTTLLLHGDGATRSFTQDASTNNFQIALNGDTKPNNLTPFITNGYWSNSFDGSGDYLTLSNATTLAFSTNDFTVEGWFNFSSNSAPAPYNQFSLINCYENQSGSFGFSLGVSTSASTLNVGNGDTNQLSTSFTISVGTWYHIAVSRSGGTIRLFVNGVLATSAANTTNFTTSTNPTAIGSLNVFGTGYTMALNGYASNVRIVKGTGLYTSNFTPSTTPLTAVTNTVLLTCQSNRFVDNSASPLTITANGNIAVSMQQPFTAPSGTSLFGSGYFDGSGDYLTAPSGAAVSGTGAFTVEFWVFMTASQTYSRIVSGAANNITINLSSNGDFDYGKNGVNSIITANAGSILNAWAHVCVARSAGGTARVWVNGTSIGTATDSNSYTAATVYIGATSVPSFYLTGYLSNLRTTNTDVYGTSNTTITVPTAPLTPVSGTSLLTLQTNGPANNNGFLDSSLNSFPVTRNGNTTQGSFTPYEANGYWSVNFTGAQTSPSLTYPSISAYDLGATSQFTYECWVYFASVSGEQSIFERFTGTSGPGWLVTKLSSNAYRTHFGASVFIDTGAIAVAGQWIHLAVSRDGSTGSLFVDGIRQATTSSVVNFSDGTDPLVFGERNSGGQTFPFNGYISNARIVKGTYVYNPSSTSITVPTSPLTAITNTVFLGLQSNRYIDNSSNNATATASSASSVQAFQPFVPTVQYTPSTLGGSGYFDGSDGLEVPTNTLLAFGANNFTIEFWANIPSTSGTGYFASVWENVGGSDSNSSWLIRLNNNGTLITHLMQGSGTYNTLTSSQLQTNVWFHCAFTRNGGTIYLFINGVLSQSASVSGSMNTAVRSFKVGYQGTANNYLTGYVSNVRVINGTALYTSAFTPPTAPLTPVTNTQLLLSMTNAAIFDNSGMNNLETVGNAQVNTSVVKYGTSSMYFDGTDDRLNIRSSPNFAFGTGDFTLECWAYFTSTANFPTLTDSRSSTGSTAGFNLGLSSAKVQLYTTSQLLIGSSTLNVNTWYHIAVTRSSGVIRIWLNGIQDASVANTTNWSDTTFVVGATPSAANFMTGYMDDLRITKGVARYVTNFTPPVARMPNQ